MSEQGGGVVEHEYNRPGNYYIMEGTWVRAPGSLMHNLGVIAEIEEHGDDSPREGSVNILWYSDSSEHLSMMSLRHKLQTRQLVVDDSQHPYDKVDWEMATPEVERRV